MQHKWPHYEVAPDESIHALGPQCSVKIPDVASVIRATLAELHGYEAAGIGRKEFKIEHLL